MSTLPVPKGMVGALNAPDVCQSFFSALGCFLPLVGNLHQGGWMQDLIDETRVQRILGTIFMIGLMHDRNPLKSFPRMRPPDRRLRIPAIFTNFTFRSQSLSRTIGPIRVGCLQRSAAVIETLFSCRRACKRSRQTLFNAAQELDNIFRIGLPQHSPKQTSMTD